MARKDDYRLRFKVERSFAWLGNFRRLLIRWEHHVGLYRSFFVVALMHICLRRLVRETLDMRDGPERPGAAGHTGTG